MKKTSKTGPKRKYIFVLGGVMSGVGKGVATSSIGLVLKSKGYRVNLVKADPYLNVDAGTMNPTEHGEVFVMRDGLETDQDMGNYERFLNEDISQKNYMTSGMVYKAVIDRERALGYGGKCVDAIPHIRDEIINRFEDAAADSNSEISVVEVGGTIGDYQNVMFMEAAHTMQLRNPKDVAVIMVSYVPIPKSIGEMKSRPTQHAAQQLSSYGLHADFVIARSEMSLDDRRKEKIAIACNIPTDHVISSPDVESIYDVAINFEKDKIAEAILERLHMPKSKTKALKLWQDWKSFVKKIHTEKKHTIRIAMVGKYFDSGEFTLSDSYLSVIEALKTAGTHVGTKVEIEWVDSKKIEKGVLRLDDIFKRCQGLIVPGGFGTSGVDGILNTIQYAREKKIPFLGICYGMQLAVIEYARSVCKLDGAHTTEIDPKTPHKIVDIMESQKENLVKFVMGGSMRLGTYPCVLTKGSVCEKLYGARRVMERHRHRYEVNNAYVDQLAKAGLVFSGTSPDGKLMEMIELPKNKHPYFVATQAHPEFRSRPVSSHPLFDGLVKAVLGK